MVHHYNEQRDDDIRKWWSEQIGLNLENFYPSSFQVSCSSNGKRKNLVNGTVKVWAKGKDVWVVKQKIIKSIDSQFL